MKHDWKHDQDLSHAKTIAETIALVLFDGGYTTGSYDDLMLFANSKVADLIYDYGDEIRNTCKAAYKQAIIDEIDRVNP